VSTLSTRAVDGPCCAQARKSLTWSSSPSATSSTEPSLRFLTQPVSPRRRASRCADARKYTPCTRPRTTRWIRFCDMGTGSPPISHAPPRARKRRAYARTRAPTLCCERGRDPLRLAAPLIDGGTKGRHEGRHPPRVHRGHDHVCLRVHVRHPLHRGLVRGRHLQRVPPVLHRQAAPGGHGGPHREVPPQVRQERAQGELSLPP